MGDEGAHTDRRSSVSAVMFRFASKLKRCAASRVWPGPLCRGAAPVKMSPQAAETNPTLGVSAAICSPNRRRMVFSCRKSSAEGARSGTSDLAAARDSKACALPPASASCSLTADSQHSFAWQSIRDDAFSSFPRGTESHLLDTGGDMRSGKVKGGCIRTDALLRLQGFSETAD